MLNPTGGELGITEAGEAVWVAKKPQTYCRQHGKRIRGWLNGWGLCDDCLVALNAIPPPVFEENDAQLP